MQDALELSQRLRLIDQLECDLWSFTPLQALLAPFSYPDLKHNYTIIDDDNRVVAMFGVVPASETTKPEFAHGIIWLLGSDLMKYHTRQFMRNNLKWLNLMQNDYPYVSNYISTANKKSIKWLRWLGFEFNLKTILVKGHEMVYFYRSSDLKKKD